MSGTNQYVMLSFLAGLVLYFQLRNGWTVQSQQKRRWIIVFACYVLLCIILCWCAATSTTIVCPYLRSAPGTTAGPRHSAATSFSTPLYRSSSLTHSQRCSTSASPTSTLLQWPVLSTRLTGLSTRTWKQSTDFPCQAVTGKRMKIVMGKLVIMEINPDQNFLPNVCHERTSLVALPFFCYCLVLPLLLQTIDYLISVCCLFILLVIQYFAFKFGSLTHRLCSPAIKVFVNSCSW